MKFTAHLELELEAPDADTGADLAQQAARLVHDHLPPVHVVRLRGVAEAGEMSTTDGIGAGDEEIYDVEIWDEDDSMIVVIEGVRAPDHERASTSPQVRQYLEQIRDEHPNATPGRVTASR